MVWDYPSSQVVNVKALWEGDLLRTAYFEKPRTQYDRTNAIKNRKPKKFAPRT